MVDQTSQFYAILTNVGAAKQANADALGIPWKITQMAVGDGNPSGVENPALPQPDASWTSLLNEWRRAPLNQLKVDDKDNSVIVAEQVIPAEIGGRWIREIALYDADGDMVAVANCAPTYKPLLNQGSGRTQVVRMNLIVSSSSNVQLKIDPSVVLATRDYVDKLTVRASQAEAEAGAESSKIMTPLRVFQAIAKVVKQSTESAFGWAKVATQAQVSSGVDDATIITPKKLRGAQATQEEAEEGADNSKIMTALRVFQGVYKILARSGIAVTNAPMLATFKAVNKGGLYLAHGATLSNATPSVPEESGNNILGVLAISPRHDATYYLAFENSAGSGGRRFWVGQYNIYNGTDSLHWSKLFSSDQVATQAQVNAGTDDATIVTPMKLRTGFAALLSGNGYIAFPTWLGGLIIQWGSVATASSATVIAKLPIEYPKAQIFALGGHVSPSSAVPISVTAYMRSTLQLNTPAAGTATIRYLSIGY